VAKDLGEAAAGWRAAREQVDDAKAAVKDAQTALQVARTDLGDAIETAARGGMRMRDMVARTGLSREWIRTVLRQRGVLADD
jgi:hypothetical protein